MKKMTHGYIQGMIETILPKVKQKYPKWNTEYSGTFEFFKSKSRAAEVDSKGVIRINECFLMAEVAEYEPNIIYLICHEFSHLIVGLHHNHDRKFRSVESDLCNLFGVKRLGLPNNKAKLLGINFKYSATYYYEYLNGETFIDTHHFSKMTKKTKMMILHPERITAKDPSGRRLKLIKTDFVQNY